MSKHYSALNVKNLFTNAFRSSTEQLMAWLLEPDLQVANPSADTLLAYLIYLTIPILQGFEH